MLLHLNLPPQLSRKSPLPISYSDSVIHVGLPHTCKEIVMVSRPSAAEGVYGEEVILVPVLHNLPHFQGTVNRISLASIVVAWVTLLPSAPLYL